MFWLPALFWIVMAHAAVYAQAEPPLAGSQGDPIPLEEIQQEQKSVAENGTLDDALKQEILATYQKAADALTQFEAARNTIGRFEKIIQDAPRDMESAKTRRSALGQPESGTALDENLELADLEKISAELIKERDASAAELEQLSAEPKRRTDRLGEIPKLIRDLETKLAEHEKAIAGEGVPEPLRRARNTLASVQKALWNASITALEKERLAYEATEELLRLQRDIESAKSNELSTRVKRLDALVNERRKSEAAQEQALAEKRAAYETDPALSGITKSIAKLAEDRARLTEAMAEASQELQAVQTTRAQVRRSYQKAQERVDAGGLSEAVGNVLRLERERLPNIARYKRNMRAREDEIGAVQFTLYELEDKSQTIASTGLDNHPDMVKFRTLQRLGMTQVSASTVRELLEKERDLIHLLRDNYNSYYKNLIDLDDAEQELIDLTEECSDYISERVLWIRSMEPLGSRDLRLLYDFRIWKSAPDAWLDTGRSLLADFNRNWMTWSAAAIVFLIIIFFQRRLRLYIGNVGSRVSRGAFTRFLPTLTTLACTVMISIPWPLLMAFLGTRLRASLSELEFTNGFANALLIVAWCWLPIEFMRQLIRNGGLADAHFDWPATSMRITRTQIHWFRFIGLPLVFIVALTFYQKKEALWSSALGRVAFVGLMFLLAYVSSRVFHPTKGALQEWYGWNRSNWICRLRHFWLAIAVSIPVIMAILAVAGYYETAQTVVVRLWATFCWAIVLIVLRALLARWVLMNRRRIALDQWRQRKQQAIDSEGSTESPAVLGTEIETIDLAAVSSQTMRLIDTAIMTLGLIIGWFVWIDVLPALGILRGVPAWPGATKPTLADTLLSLATLIVTYLLARNIPGLLELGILKHLPLDGGARYAIANLTRYALVIVGFSMAGAFVGISWQSIQWLVAAVGIGLGFGLQEIFANFVSGIVLLFEQPLRVGDVVSLGETTGVVSRIRIRATTIRDWDYKEYIVPNKDLITGTLLNWTLTNQTNRIVITVGVAYGSDTERARELLTEIAKNHPRVVDDPTPFACFEKFGESALDMVLRCYLGSLEDRLQTINDLHTSIDHEFKKAGIEIAFPQRDIHLRTIAGPIPTRDAID